MAIVSSSTIKIIKDPLFIVGLLLRLTLIPIALTSIPLTDWYAPFLLAGTGSILDPWTNWVSSGNTLIAFPYGYAMWVILLPGALICELFNMSVGLGYCASLLVIDLGMLFTLNRLFPAINSRRLLLAYWLSPILLIATYVLGLNDLIPIFILVLALYAIQQRFFIWAGCLLAIAISAKLSMLLALPFFGIYFIHNKVVRHHFSSFILSLLTVMAITIGPFIASAGAVLMLFGNPEIPKLYQFALPINTSTYIYLAPLAYTISVYTAWSIKRMNFDLFQATLGIGFIAIVLLTPASAGWFIWTLPLLVYYQAVGSRKALLLCGLFSALFAIINLFPAESLEHLLSQYSGGINLVSKISSLLHSLLLATGFILVALIWKNTIANNAYFTFSRKPFALGIAGDSGSGKDTLSLAIEKLFGSHSVVTLSGDDYHLWDRQKPLWQVITHLNPLANDLEGFSNALVDLTLGKSIQSRNYDHQSGKLSSSSVKKSNDIIIASGLHTLHLPILRDCLDLKIFLDIHEGLRRQLKIIRDTQVRGHSQDKVLESLEKRASDSERFIKPQIEYADLIFSLQPVLSTEHLQETTEAKQIKLRLDVQSKIGLNSYDLTRILIGICGLHVNQGWNQTTKAIELSIEGDVTAEDISLAVSILCPRISEFLYVTPKWESGSLGLMQLITLIHIDKLLTRRYL